MTAIDHIRRRALGRPRPRGSRLVQMRTTVRESAIDASRILHDPGNRRHQRAAVRHLRRAARRAQRIGVARAIDDSRVRWQLRRGYRHVVAGTEVPHRRVVRRVVAGGVLTGLVVGGAAAGISRVRPASPGSGAERDGDAPDGESEQRP
jgi:hypothetical protein